MLCNVCSLCVLRESFFMCYKEEFICTFVKV